MKIKIDNVTITFREFTPELRASLAACVQTNQVAEGQVQHRMPGFAPFALIHSLEMDGVTHAGESEDSIAAYKALPQSALSVIGMAAFELAAGRDPFRGLDASSGFEVLKEEN